MILVRELIIDKGREEHIAKHGVTPEEAEEVCRGDPTVKTYDNR